MELSTFSHIVGVIELLMGIPLLVAPGRMSKWLGKFIKEDLLTPVVGAILFILAFLILENGYSVDTSVAGLMRLVAWIVLIKGLIMCWWPHWIDDIARAFLGNKSLCALAGIVSIVLGFLFLIAGYMV